MVSSITLTRPTGTLCLKREYVAGLQDVPSLRGSLRGSLGGWRTTKGITLVSRPLGDGEPVLLLYEGRECKCQSERTSDSYFFLTKRYHNFLFLSISYRITLPISWSQVYCYCTVSTMRINDISSQGVHQPAPVATSSEYKIACLHGDQQ